MEGRTDSGQLEFLRKEALDKDIINLLAQRIGVNHRKAMDLYYQSRLAEQISIGQYGIQYLDAAYLVDDLLCNEGELFGR